MNKSNAMLLVLWIAGLAFAKRMEPEHVPPVAFHGVLYSVSHFNREPPWSMTGGVIEAHDSATGKRIGRYLIYTTFRTPFVEDDVQYVYIRSMTLDTASKTLHLVDERDNSYTFDLEHHRLTGLRSWLNQYGWMLSMVLVIGFAFAFRRRWKQKFEEEMRGPGTLEIR